MGAPVIIIERMFSGRECISSLEAAAAIAFNQNQVKEKTGDGIHEAEDVQDLIKTEVNLVLQYSLDSYNRKELNIFLSCYFGGARSKGFATLRNVSKLQFFDKIGQAKSVGFRFYSAI